MTFMERIESEFGEPFFDVLQGFADMGYGCDTTARMLDYDISNFRRLLKRHAIEIAWPDAGARIDAYDRNPWPGVEAMVKARRAMAPRYTNPRTGETMIASHWAKRIGISTTHFLRRVKRYGESSPTFAPSSRSRAA